MPDPAPPDGWLKPRHDRPVTVVQLSAHPARQLLRVDYADPLTRWVGAALLVVDLAARELLQAPMGLRARLEPCADAGRLDLQLLPHSAWLRLAGPPEPMPF
ncbi:hypothetical protein [Phenylobacterium sp.]|uniref:hypothetical protein n=1 Tax=Phenylobacterium sp. TaxID=1871053 RepID=UPI002CB1EE8E|nr:hypothetical protein [Phenylobacterium sp.]HVI30669.1 hypothetical protein [Phenylobacterium sp.]